jgi:WD40 repeat protein
MSLSLSVSLSHSLSLAEDRLCALTADGQLLSIPLLSSLSVLAQSLTADSIKYTISSFHSPRAIIGLDVCTKKSIFVTAGKDNTVRLWNIQTHQLDLCKEFGEEILSIALHPSGLHLAIGFQDKVRLFHILLDDLRLCTELAIKGCRECRFRLGLGLGLRLVLGDTNINSNLNLNPNP